MKKLTTLAFALAILTMTFVACGGGEMEEAPPPAETAAPAAEPAESAPAEEMPAEGEAQPKAQ